VVSEVQYQTLIQNKFSGVEPVAIREVRKHIATPFGDANMTDQVWGAVGSSVNKMASASFPVFVFEKNRHSLSNIGFFTAGFALDGDIWIKDGRSQRTVIKMRNPPPCKTMRGDQSIRLKGNDGEDFEFDISANWDFMDKCAEFEVQSKGIRFSATPAGGKTSSSVFSKSVIVTREKLHNHSRLLMSAIKRVNREFDGIIVNGVDPEQGEVPWFLLDEFEFKQPQPDLAPTPKEYKRAKADGQGPRRNTA
jgi:hypothetical protein